MATPTRLTPQQRRQLNDDGYLLIPSVLDPADLARIAARLAEHVRQTVATWAEDPRLDTHGGAVTTRFDLDDPGLAPCYQHPLVTDAAAAVLADGWHLQGIGLRAPIPGSGEQGLHQDFEARGTGPTWQALSAMWCISEFTRDNGPLRVIPGSHLASEPPIDIKHGYATGMGPPPRRGENHRGRRIRHPLQQPRPLALRHLQLHPRRPAGPNRDLRPRPSLET